MTRIPIRQSAILLAITAVALLSSPRFEDFPSLKFPLRTPSSNSPEFQSEITRLLTQLTAEEKAGLLVNDSPGVPRLGIPPYNWWNEALHGVMHRYAPTTVFPQPIGLGASFDDEMLKRVAEAVGDEARALFNNSVQRGENLGQFMGVSLWSPNLNLLRDPRWGRGHETYGEDPYLISRMGVAYVKGLQGDDPFWFKTIATPKHYVAHNGPEKDRLSFDTKISQQDLWDSEMPGFRAAVVEGHAFSIMTSYNSINGVPASANSDLVGRTLRGLWGFPGYVVTDCGAVSGIFWSHFYALGIGRAVDKALSAGVDLDCGREFRDEVPGLIRSGRSAKVDQAVSRVLEAELRLGLIGDPRGNPYSAIAYSTVGSAGHDALALEAAHKSIVLLKNQGDVLPLDPAHLRKLLVIGPNADTNAPLLGTYSGQPTRVSSALQALRERLPNTQISYYQGVGLSQTSAGTIKNPHCRTAALYHNGAIQMLGSPLLQGTYGIASREYYRAGNPADAPRGLNAYYYADGAKDAPTVTRIDDSIRFNWDGRTPDVFPPDYSKKLGENFSVRWDGFLRLPRTGATQLVASYDDGVRIKLNGQLAVDDWNAGGSRESCLSLEGSEGELVPIEITYFQAKGKSKMQLLSEQGYELGLIARDAREADAVVAFMGLDPSLEAETVDRADALLPALQEDFLLTLEHEVGTKPLVAVLLNGNPVTLGKSLDGLAGLLEAWYPGQLGGYAVADVLLGRYNPAGRMPATAYAPAHTFAPLSDYSMRDRTYRYLRETPQFPFGYGLSYTSFVYEPVSLPTVSPASGGLNASVKVTNTGPQDGEEVVQLYAKYLNLPTYAARGYHLPDSKLAAFRRIFVPRGESRTVSFELTPRDLALVDRAGKTISPAGMIRIWVGGGQPPSPARTQPVIGVGFDHARSGEDFELPGGP